ncbi:hypothetical protein [Achromobacter sp. ESBL13]|uniref:hypothetical protein n=1 Tax=Achromobacter sp. ESBL13 TaxID=3077328 RepID=UPI002FC82F9C
MASPTLPSVPQAAPLPLTGAATSHALTPPSRLPLTGPTTGFRLSLGILLAIVFWMVAGSLLVTLWLASQRLA